MKIVAGDQLTIARQRSILNIRVGHEYGSDLWKHIVLMPGLFHAKIADCHGLLIPHFGVSSTHSPGSLAFHNTCLHRMPIVLTPLPSFRACRDLIMVSLYARILHCLLIVSGTKTLNDYTQKVTTLASLRSHSRRILEQFANADIVHTYREPREIAERQCLAKIKAEDDARKAKLKADQQSEKAAGKKTAASTPATEAAESTTSPVATAPPVKSTDASIPQPRTIETGDEVFENALLFTRDSLFTRLFSDVVKAGDSGMVVIILKLWTLGYRGSGRVDHKVAVAPRARVGVWIPCRGRMSNFNQNTLASVLISEKYSREGDLWEVRSDSTSMTHSTTSTQGNSRWSRSVCVFLLL